MTRKSPRAARLSRNEAPSAPESPAPASAPAPAPGDRAALLREIEAAREFAEREGNASAAVQALSLKAKVLGDAIEPEPEELPDTQPATPRDTARALLGTVRELSAQLRDLLGVELVVKYPGESVLRVRDPDLPVHMHAGEPALSLEVHLARGSSVVDRDPVYSAGGTAIRVGDFTITFGERAEQGRSRPVAEWIITDSTGAVRGRRLTGDEAITFAQSLGGN